MKELLPTRTNVHKLLRIVWVFVEMKCLGKEIEQGVLPIELAKKLSNLPEDELNKKENMPVKVDKPLTCEKVEAALERLLSIFHEVYKNEDVPEEIREKFQPPPEWEESNPCRDGNIRYRR